MEKETEPIHQSPKSFEQLKADNRRAVERHNEKALSTLLFLGWVLVLLPLIAVPFSYTKAGAVPAYVSAFVVFFAMFWLDKLPVMKKYTILELYACFSVLFLLSIYLSVVHSPNMRATILLGGFVIMPLSFIDRPRRVRLFLLFWLAAHTALAFYWKPRYALDDAINCLCAAVLGCYLGESMARDRLESFEARRFLVIEKETDVLTGLYNRRKLFETLAHLETAEAEKPTGAFMLDIDHFKEFNDSYGHAAGDECLCRIGQVQAKFSQNFRLRFYRYGGEEFVALAYGYGEKELLSIADSLRIAAEGTLVAGHRVTVSIGVAYCGETRFKNYERVIGRADEAAYAAKRAGRNCVRMERME